MGGKIVKPSFKRVDPRGTFLEILNSGRWESVLCGDMRKGAVMGNHYHKRTTVFFFLCQGGARVVFRGPKEKARREQPLKPLEGIILQPGAAHAIRFNQRSSFIMLKSRAYRKSRPDTFPLPVL